MPENPLRRDPAKIFRRMSVGGAYGSKPDEYIGGLDDIWMDDKNLNILRRGDGVTPGGIIIGANGTANLSNYATRSYVDNAINGMSTFSGSYNDLTDVPAPQQIDVDLSAYMTTEVGNALHDANYARISVLETSADTLTVQLNASIEIQAVADARISNLEASDDLLDSRIAVLESATAFSGSYNDLTDIPENVDLSLYATIAYLQEEIKKMSNPTEFITSHIYRGAAEDVVSAENGHDYLVTSLVLSPSCEVIEIDHKTSNDDILVKWGWDSPVDGDFILPDSGAITFNSDNYREDRRMIKVQGEVLHLTIKRSLATSWMGYPKLEFIEWKY
jgi:hypothetical protein